MLKKFMCFLFEIVKVRAKLPQSKKLAKFGLATHEVTSKFVARTLDLEVLQSGFGVNFLVWSGKI